MKESKTKKGFRAIAMVSALAVLGSCATILHPERRGNHGGHIDTVPLIVDILLFIPGLLPGVIALAVDFGSGAIYTGGGSAMHVHDVGRRGKIAIQSRDLPEGSDVELRLVDAQGHVIDRDRLEPTGARTHGRLSVDLRRAASSHPEPGKIPLTLELQVDDEPPARYALLMRSSMRS